MTVLRWIGVFPGALAGGWVAWIIVNLLNRITFAWEGFDESSFLSRLYIDGVSHGVLGAAGVYAGAKIAPAHRAPVVFVLAGVFVLGAGFLLFPAILLKNWWAVYAVAALAIGAGSIAWQFHTGEVKID